MRRRFNISDNGKLFVHQGGLDILGQLEFPVTDPIDTDSEMALFWYTTDKGEKTFIYVQPRDVKPMKVIPLGE